MTGLNGLRQSVFKWVSGTHVTVLLLMLIVPWIRGCLHKRPEIIATFDLGAPPPPEIQPEPAPEPKPLPKPEPIKKAAPKPVVTNTPPKAVKQEPKKETPRTIPKKTETKTPKPKAAVTNAPAKPKTDAERLAEIRQNTKVRNPNVTAAPARPQLDFSGIKSALNNAGSAYGTGSGSGGGVYSPFAGYYESVKQRMYAVWQQPAGAPVGLTATAVVRVERDGTVSVKSITRRSGNAQFDQSVQSALNTTTRLPIPPADLPDRNISIEFALAD